MTPKNGKRRQAKGTEHQLCAPRTAIRGSDRTGMHAREPGHLESKGIQGCLSGVYGRARLCVLTRDDRGWDPGAQRPRTGGVCRRMMGRKPKDARAGHHPVRNRQMIRC